MIEYLSAVAVSAVAFVFVFNWLWKTYIHRHSHIKVEGLTNVPLLGHLHHFPRDPTEFFKRLLKWIDASTYVLAFWFGPVPIVGTARQEDAEIMLKDQLLLAKSYLYSFLHPWLRSGLLTSDGSKWKARRKLLTPAFHFSILNDFAHVFYKEACILVEKMKPYSETNEVFDICQPITLCTLDIICGTAMGAEIEAQSGHHTEYTNAIKDLSRAIQIRQRSPWLWSDFIFKHSSTGRDHDKSLKILHGFTDKIIKEKLASRGQGSITADKPKRKVAFLDLLLDYYDAKEIDFQGLQEEVDTFMFEGHDTTSSGISWALYLLGRHPEIQKKVHEELDQYFVDDLEGLIDATKKMDLLGRVIKESLRLFPPVPFVGRRVTEDSHVIGKDIKLKKGENLVLSIFALHRNKQIWEDPCKFDPDRFLPENSQGRHPFAYVPFSAGSRNCIGQRFALLEEKIVLAKFLKHYEIKSLDPMEKIDLVSELITRAEDGIRVQIKPRNA